MFRGLHGLRAETQSRFRDAGRIVTKSSERGDPPCDADPIEVLVRIVGEAHDDPRSRNDAGTHRTGERG